MHLVTLYIKLWTVCGKIKKNDDAGQLFLASLDKLTKDGNKLFVNLLLASQHLLNNKNEFSDKIDRLQYKRNQYKSF